MTTHTCIGLFDDRRQADAAVEDLRRLGLARTDISAAFRGQPGRHDFRGGDEPGNLRGEATDDATSAHDTAATGLAWLFLGAGATVLNPLLAPIVATGALMGGLANALADAVVPEEHDIAKILMAHGMDSAAALYHQERVANGAFLLLIPDCARWGTEQVRAILVRHGAEERPGWPALDQTGPADTFETSAR